LEIVPNVAELMRALAYAQPSGAPRSELL